MYICMIAHMLHVWYIYLQNWVISRANVGKSSSTMVWSIGAIAGVIIYKSTSCRRVPSLYHCSQATLVEFAGQTQLTSTCVVDVAVPI